MSDNCKLELILSKTTVEICELAKKCSYNYINLNQFHYCYLNGNIYISLPLFVILGIICFYLLSDTANKYLSEALTNISERLKLSQNLAGVTLLALGNGANDVISSIIASDGDEDEGLDVAIGSLLGGGIFVSCLVFSMVIFIAKNININRNMFIRDILLYIFVMLYLIYILIMGKITILETILIFMIYFIYVIIAILQDCYFNSNKTNDKNHKKNIHIDENNSLIDNEFNNFNCDQENSNILEKEREKFVEFVCKKIDQNFYIGNEDITLSGNKGNNMINLNDSNEIERRSTINFEYFYRELNHKKIYAINKDILKLEINDRINDPILPSGNLFSLFCYFKRCYFHHHKIMFKEMNFLRKIIYLVIEFPTTLLRDITIPCCNPERWNKSIFILFPLCSLIFIVATTNSSNLLVKNSIYLSIFIAMISIITFLIWLKTYRSRMPNNKLFLSILSFIMSLFWMWFIAKILMNILNSMGLVLKVPESFLALTLLSIGNSSADISLNCALARSGYGEMGLAGSIAGPLFNLMIGFGLSALKKLVNYRTNEIIIHFSTGQTSMLITVGVIIILNLIRLLFQAVHLKFKLNRSISYFGFVFYFIFLLFICFNTYNEWKGN